VKLRTAVHIDGQAAKTVDYSDNTIWTRVESIASGEHRATLTNIRLALGASSGKPMFVWSFTLDSGQTVEYYTSKRGVGARKGYSASKALGLSRSFTPSEAVGRQCRLTLDSSGPFVEVVAVKPL
jgi:hypothetical protein